MGGTQQMLVGFGGAIFAQDAFSGTVNADLNTHTANIGGAWARHPSYAGAISLDGSGGVFASSANSTGLYYLAATPPGPDYTVQATFTLYTSGYTNGINGRMDTAVDTTYRLRWSIFSNTWELEKFIAGAYTELGAYSDTFTSGSKVA